MSSPARPYSVVQRHQLASYFGLTSAISWASWLGLMPGSLHIQTTTGAVLNVVAIAGRSIAALLLATVSGRVELRCLLAGFPLSRLSVRWMVVAPVLAVSVTVFGALTWLVAIGVVVRSGRARLASRPRVEVATAR